MPAGKRGTGEDVAFVDSRGNPSIILSIPAQFTLASRRDASGVRRQFTGRIVNISLYNLAMFTPTIANVGERAIVQCDEFGKLEGTVSRLLNHGFAMTVASTAERRAVLQARIEMYESIKNHDFTDRRRHKRIAPPDCASVVVFGDNNKLQCNVLDISSSGAAVLADIKPPVGTQLSLGDLPARVVRHFSNGFAIEFVKPPQ